MMAGCDDYGYVGSGMWYQPQTLPMQYIFDPDQVTLKKISFAPVELLLCYRVQFSAYVAHSAHSLPRG